MKISNFQNPTFLSGKAGALMRFSPEPSGGFLSYLNKMLGTGGAAVTGALTGGMEPQYVQLMQEQMHQQEQLQLVTMASNTEKSKHEIAMTPLRNVRVA